MHGYLSIILHAHLPFVRHPEEDRFLEESWFYEAVLETYLPLIELFRQWEADGIQPRLTMTVSPTLCAMLNDPLLRQRCARRIEALIDLAKKECARNLWQPETKAVAEMYLHRFQRFRDLYQTCNQDLVRALAQAQHRGVVQIIPCSATHAVLPLLAGHPPSIRAQILAARDSHLKAFGQTGSGFWLPECAYDPVVEPALAEGGYHWTVLESHGLLNASTRPRYGVFAPILSRSGLAVFGRDSDAARQVWSRQGGYPGDFRYREFYRDIGFDLDFDYVQPCLPSPAHRGFTGLKYHAITGLGDAKRIYDRRAAMEIVRQHAAHFVQARTEHLRQLSGIMDRPPLIVCPYDAELFGHWWFEGPEFLDWVVRIASQPASEITLIDPSEYLRRHSNLQLSEPSPSSWGEGGHSQVWLDETNAWIHAQLHPAQVRMSALASQCHHPSAIQERALRLAGNELLLAQSSDWPFILKTGSSPGYAKLRVEQHLASFHEIARQMETQSWDVSWLDRTEPRDSVFPDLDWRYWQVGGG